MTGGMGNWVEQHSGRRLSQTRDGVRRALETESLTLLQIIKHFQSLHGLAHLSPYSCSWESVLTAPGRLLLGAVHPLWLREIP